MIQRPITCEVVLQRAQKFCAYQERCRKQVEDWLLRLKINPAECDKVLTKLEEERFIDEERFTVAYVRGKFKLKGWGKVKIRMHLQALGIDKDVIDAGLGEIPPEIYTARLEELLEKKAASLDDCDPYQRMAKLTTYAYTKGYEYPLIRESIEKIIKNIPDHD
jgi:regulatory protein